MMSLCVRVSLVTTRRPAAQKRRAATSRNPLRQLAARGDLLSGYTQVRTDVAERELRRIKRQQSQSHPPLHPPTVSLTPPLHPPTVSLIPPAPPTSHPHHRSPGYREVRTDVAERELRRIKRQQSQSHPPLHPPTVSLTPHPYTHTQPPPHTPRNVEQFYVTSRCVRTNEGGHVSTKIAILL